MDEVEMIKRNLEAEQRKELNKQQEIIKIDFEFKHSQTEAYYKSQVQQLQQKIEYLQSEFIKDREQEMKKHVVEQINRVEERNV